jgi:hypothetical protein
MDAFARAVVPSERAAGQVFSFADQMASSAGEVICLGRSEPVCRWCGGIDTFSQTPSWPGAGHSLAGEALINRHLRLFAGLD